MTQAKLSVRTVAPFSSANAAGADSPSSPKREIAQLFLSNKSALTEISALVMYTKRSEATADFYYLIAQSTLDFLDAAIQRDRAGMDMAEKDQFVYAGIVYAHYDMALRLGLLSEQQEHFGLDPAFEEEIKNVVINAPTVCTGSNLILRNVIVESLPAAHH